MIDNLASLRTFFQEKITRSVVGIASFPYFRFGPEEFLPKYHIFSLNNSLESSFFADNIELFCLADKLGQEGNFPLEKITYLISHPLTRKILQKLNDPLLLGYRPRKELADIAQKEKVAFAFNSYDTTEFLLDKTNFRGIGQKIGLAMPMGEVVLTTAISFSSFAKKFGLPFVIQLPNGGGGRGTFFIKNKEDLGTALSLAAEWEAKKVVVAQYIKGVSPSITGCVTRHGILSTALQYQVLSQPQLRRRKGSGLFCGHDWTSSRFPESVNQQAYKIINKLGNYLKKIGYRGIFGLDFILEEKTGKLFLIECNPRWVESLPVLTQAQAANNEPPILAFHILEFLNVSYDLDVEKVNDQMRKNRPGGQLLLHNLSDRLATVGRLVQPGVYRLNSDGGIRYLRPGYRLEEIKDEGEFLLVDKLKGVGGRYAPDEMMVRIITKKGLLNQSANLNSWAQKVAEEVYASFNLY